MLLQLFFFVYRRDLPEPPLRCSPPSFLGAGALGGGLVLCGGGV
jgi:hypothetical protein